MLHVALSNPIQVASKDTLWSRAVRTKEIPLPPADLIIVDECHHSMSKTWRELLAMYPNAVIIGLTATPSRGDGCGLEELYQGMVQAISCTELIEQGFLVPYKVFAPYRPDLKGVKISSGDYNRQQLEQRMDKSELVGDIVENWHKLAEGRQTIVFASGVEHSIHLAEAFTRSGVPAMHLDGKTPIEDRDEIMRMVMGGDIQILCNCDVCTEGTDIPPVSCVVLARPTKSIVKYKQMVGRGMRPWEGKVDALLLDHAGCVYRHGFPDEDVPWTLSGKEKIDTTYQKLKAEGKVRDPIVCKACHAVFFGKPECPNCGAAARQKRGKAVKTKDGLLTELNRGETYQPTREEKQRYWHRCLGVTANKGRTLKHAAAMYSDHFGEPPWNTYGLSNVPVSGSDWSKKTSDVFPGFVKGGK